MGSIVSCATRNEVKQQTYEQRRMHAAYAEYFSKLEQGLKGELPFQVVVRLLTDDDEAVAASEEESERQERELERALQCALLVLLLTLDALHRMSANAERTRLESALGNSDVAAAAAHSGVPRGCERWMAFERAHSASLSRLDFATLAERSKALYFAKVNDLIRISHPRLELRPGRRSSAGTPGRQRPTPTPSTRAGTPDSHRTTSTPPRTPPPTTHTHTLQETGGPHTPHTHTSHTHTRRTLGKRQKSPYTR